MKIEFNDDQLSFLKEILGEYAEMCYQEMFDCKRVALEADEKFVKDEYNAMAEEEEARFGRAKALSEYIVKYEELMKNV